MAVDAILPCTYYSPMRSCTAIRSLGFIARRWTTALLLAILALSFTGCGLDPIDERDPRLRRARELKNSEDYEGAIRLYEQALRRKPNLARAHWELGTLYDQVYQDDIRAIYHYRSYLELDPEAERRDIVEDLIDVAHVSFASSLARGADSTLREVRRLKQENAALADLLTQEREQIRRLKAELAGQPLPEPAVAAQSSGRPPERPDPAPPRRGETTYVVQPGDTLSSIARRLYGSPAAWDTIFEANRESLSSPQSIRVGQVLRIPGDG